jgi:hypothetical protein
MPFLEPDRLSLHAADAGQPYYYSYYYGLRFSPPDNVD